MNPLSADEMNREFHRKKAMLNFMEFRNQELLEKDQRINAELQETRTMLIKGLQNMLSSGLIHTDIGIKRMGAIDEKIFLGPCKERFGANVGPLKAAELTSLWQKNLRKSSWVPFLITVEAEFVHEEDPKLLSLKEEWGDEAYKAVIVALKEILEYNPFKRTVVSELWNFKEDRKATLNEIIDYMSTSLETLQAQETATTSKPKCMHQKG